MHGETYKYPMSVTKALRLAGLIDTSHSSQEAMDRGTAIHAACEYWDQDDLEMSGLDDKIRPYLDAWIKFRKDSGCEILGVEVQIDSDTHRYSGRIDRHVKIGDKEGVLDIKSGVPAPWHALQTAAYCEGLTARWTVYLSREGTYRIVEHTDRHDWPKFLLALSVAKMRVAWGLDAER